MYPIGTRVRGTGLEEQYYQSPLHTRTFKHEPRIPERWRIWCLVFALLNVVGLVLEQSFFAVPQYFLWEWECLLWAIVYWNYATWCFGFFLMLGGLKIKRLFGSQKTLSFEFLNSVGILGALKTFTVRMNKFYFIASWGQEQNVGFWMWSVSHGPCLWTIGYLLVELFGRVVKSLESSTSVEKVGHWGVGLDVLCLAPLFVQSLYLFLLQMHYNQVPSIPTNVFSLLWLTISLDL